MRKLKEFIVELADDSDGFIIVDAMNAEIACKKAEKMGYEVFYAHKIDSNNY